MNKFFADLTGQSAIEGTLLLYPADAGAGAGGSGASPSSGDVSGAGTGGGAQGAGAGTGSGTPYRLTDESMVDLGDGKPVRWSDHRSQYMSRADYDAAINRGQQFLMGYASDLEKREKALMSRGQQPGQAQVGQQPRKDPLEGISELGVVDGKTLDRLARSLRDEGLVPVANIVRQMGEQNKQLLARLEKLEGTSTTLAQQHSTNQFEDIVTGIFPKIGEIAGLRGALDPQDKGLREIVKDVYLSHDPKDPTLMTELPKLVNERLTAMVRIVRALDKAAVEDSRTRMRQKFANPSLGRAQGTGPGKYVHQTGDQLAAEFFAAQREPALANT